VVNNSVFRRWYPYGAIGEFSHMFVFLVDCRARSEDLVPSRVFTSPTFAEPARHLDRQPALAKNASKQEKKDYSQDMRALASQENKESSFEWVILPKNVI